MDFKKFSLLAAAAIALLYFAVSCKDDDDDDTEYMSGTLTFTSIPAFVLVGAEFELTPDGVYRDDGGDFGIYWYCDYDSVKDTVVYEGEEGDGTWTFVVPDTLSTVTVYCYAYADGYYSSSASAEAVIVDPGYGRTVTGNDLPGDSSWITDSRDGKRYYYTTIGSLDWTRTNIAYTEFGVPYYDCSAMTNIFGQYYTWTEAQEACPDGWRVPSGEDWLDLAEALGVEDAQADDTFYGISGNLVVDAYFNVETRMWEYWPAVTVNNSTLFSALPTGYATVLTEGHTWGGAWEYAAYWTSEEDDEGRGYYRYFYAELPDIHLGRIDKDAMVLPIRCVRDSE